MAAWTPADLGTSVKVRIDSSALGLSDGALITSLTPTVGPTFTNYRSSPIYKTAAQNGLGVIRFGNGGLTSGLVTSSSVSLGERTIAFAMGRYGDNIGAYGEIMWHNGPPYYEIFTRNGSYNFGISSSSVFDQAVVNFDTIFGIYVLSWDNNNFTIRKNGGASSNSFTTNASGVINSYISFFSEWAGSQADLGEVVLSSTLVASDIEKLEGYLAWKWNTQSLLPSGHTYKAAAPGAATATAAPITVCSFI